MKPFYRKTLLRFLPIIFNLERANQLSLLPDKDLADFCPLIEPYQVTKNPVVLGVESVEMARYLTTVRIVLFILIYVS
ncbi:MAG: hypothetical protein EWV67_04130 [Microcystis sp. M_QC_C_20170808_M2Col]|nr:MAG: hypothetical protein EWV68_22460 [Microcystis sp. M_QC_C_20170808_M9Col]TRT67568.1 MAG: hypothetical protein EWV67_04130 [Microcystis sp. M_QC_C_20170808_M2Col]